jgi:hypothetical protein
MPELEKMTCGVCEQIKAPEAIDEQTGICHECLLAIEGEGLDPEDESDPELRKAIAQYQKRREYMRRYNSKPEVRARRREYQRERNKRLRELVAKAKELRLIE